MAIEMKNKNQFPNTLFFFDFSNTLKQIKVNLFNPKTLAEKHLKDRNFSLLKS